MAKKKKKPKFGPEGARILVRNKKALHHYQIHQRIEAGVSLVGSEVKSLRESRASLAEGYVDIRDGQAWLIGVQINEYPWANQFNHDPLRKRRLLLHKEQIRKLGIKTQQRGFTLVPLAIYLNDKGRIKVELALATGKQLYEKRESAKERTARREIDQAMKKGGR